MRNESEWAYLPLSEERVVAQQLKNRSKQDPCFQERQQIGTTIKSQGGFALDEAIQSTYIDLDRLISECAFSKETIDVLQQIMSGYSLRDIAEIDDREFSSIEREFRNAVARIVRQNNAKWTRIYARKACRGQK